MLRNSNSVICRKCVMMGFNISFFIAGLLIIFIGIWKASDEGREALEEILQPQETPFQLHHLAYSLIFLGCISLIVSAIGTWAILKDNKPGQILYISLVTVIILLKMVTGALALTYQASVTDSLSMSILTRLQTEYGSPQFDAFTKVFDYVQSEFLCCGVNDPNDWLTSGWRSSFPGIGRNVPLTCCTLGYTSNLFLGPTPINEIECQRRSPVYSNAFRYQEGCFDKILEWLNMETGILIGVSLGLGILEIAGLIASASLCIALKDHKI